MQWESMKLDSCVNEYGVFNSFICSTIFDKNRSSKMHHRPRKKWGNKMFSHHQPFVPMPNRKAPLEFLTSVASLHQKAWLLEAILGSVTEEFSQTFPRAWGMVQHRTSSIFQEICWWYQLVAWGKSKNGMNNKNISGSENNHCCIEEIRTSPSKILC